MLHLLLLNYHSYSPRRAKSILRAAVVLVVPCVIRNEAFTWKIQAVSERKTWKIQSLNNSFVPLRYLN